MRERALTVAWFGGFSGFTIADLVRGANVGPDEAAALIDELKRQGELVDVVISPARRVLLHKDMVQELEERLLAALSRLHEQYPLLTTHDRQKVQSQLDYVGDEALVHAAVERLIQRKQLVGDLRRMALANFKPKLSANLRKLKDKVIEAYLAARFQPPEPATFTASGGRQRGEPERSLRGVRRRRSSGACRPGRVFARRRRHRDAPFGDGALAKRRRTDGGRDPRSARHDAQIRGAVVRISRPQRRDTA